MNPHNTKRQAELLKSSLTRLDFGAWKENVLKLVSLGGLVAAAGTALSPSGPGTCDHNAMERCANCITSAPYIACGIHSMRKRKTTAGKLWGASLLGVAGASCAFHASSGDIRPACRRLDFWTIAASSNLMLRSVFPRCPAVLTALGIAATPFRPFVVSLVNSTAMEIKYLHRARQNPKLRSAQRIHAAACLVGLGCFALEDICPQIPLMHAAWHCLSATAVCTINNLAADVEEQEVGILSPVSMPVVRLDV